ncbi:hypothetical protein DH2020_008448 [Rehmannia glutinosa]|uniref:F-box domain-containing protein n=1 Tax=Rehmannia glutinosa TaxID=99300 RepID=A0ABR0U100_REHGL
MAVNTGAGPSTKSTTINDLPESLVIHILSFVPTLEAVATSVLARGWRYLWLYVPTLDFDILASYQLSRAPFALTRARFSDSIARTFFLRPIIHLHSFRLAFHYADLGRRKREVRWWIRRSVDQGVTKIMLEFYDDAWMTSYRGIRLGGENNEYNFSLLNDHRTFKFSFEDIMNGSVAELRLRNCSLRFPTDISNGFDSLHTLVLHNIELSSNEHFNSMVLACANLQTLTVELIRNTGGTEIQIHSKSIKVLVLRDHVRIDFDEIVTLDIDVPSLGSLTLTNFVVNQYILVEYSSLVEVDLDFTNRYDLTLLHWNETLLSLGHVKSLRTQNMKNGTTTLPRFHFLQDLELITGFAEGDLRGIFEFLRVSPRLERLVLDYTYFKSAFVDVDPNDVYYFDSWKLSEEFKRTPVHLQMSSLKRVILNNFRNTEDELYLVELFKTQKVVLEEIIAFPPPHGKALSSSAIVLWSA